MQITGRQFTKHSVSEKLDTKKYYLQAHQLIFRAPLQLMFTGNSVYLESMYKNWWDPPEEVIVIKPKDKSKAAITSGAGGGRAGKTDQVF